MSKTGAQIWQEYTTSWKSEGMAAIDKVSSYSEPKRNVTVHVCHCSSFE